MPSFAAATFQNDLIPEEFRSDWSNTPQKLIGILFVFLSEVLPLPPEVGRCRRFVSLNILKCHEARYAAHDGKSALA
jgi:hypothetical protein